MARITAVALLGMLVLVGRGAAQPDVAFQPDSASLIQPMSDNGGKAGKKKRAKVEVSGFLTTQYEFRVEQNQDSVKDPSGFRIGKAVVRVKGRVNDYVGYTVEIDPRSPTIAGIMRDGYISIRWIPKHEIRIGQQKVPFGYENWQSSTQLYTHHRSELSEGAGRGATHRDIGVGLVGKLKLATNLRIEDAIAVVNGNGFGVQADNTPMKNVWGRVGLCHENKDAGIVVRTGLSGAVGDQVEPADPGPPPESAFRFAFKRLGGDLEVDHRWGFFGAEYANSWDEIPAGSGEVELSSSYFIMLAGKTSWHVGPVVKYEAGDADEFTRFTVGAYWGELDAPVRVLIDYEYWKDVFGIHDGRVTTQLSVVF